MNKFLFPVLLLACRLCTAQNLVPNGDFETNTGLPTAAGQYSLCTGWSNCGGFGSPDYDHMNGSGSAHLPYPHPSTVYPHGGNAIMGICLYDVSYPNFREYASRALLNPLVPGQNYRLTFYVTNGAPPIYYGGNGVDQFSVAFSTKPLVQPPSLVINCSPQFICYGFLYSYTWQQEIFDFKADSAYQYITFGSFVNDAIQKLQYHDLAISFSEAYYFIDDVTLQASTATKPAAAFETTDTTLCPTACINFANLSTNATAWHWFFPGALPPSDTTANPQNICYLDPGSYDVTMVALNNNGTDTLSLKNYIHVYDAPPAPLITQHDDTLFCSYDSSYTSYQWYDDSTLLAGETRSYLVFSHNGNFNIQVENMSGCKIAVGINILAAPEHSSESNQGISPNPVRDKIVISRSLTGEKRTITILNVLGEIIYRDVVDNSRDIAISSTHFLPGFYLLKVETDSRQWTYKFIKE